MALPKFQDEALVVLKIAEDATKHRRTPAANHLERRVLLSRTNPSIKIGRTSRRKADLEPSSNNFYFDCPVMSREHAVLFLDTESKVAIKDSNSLHGTYVNKIQLGRQERRQIQAGDILTFGMTVDRGILQYYPLQVEADITFGTQVSRPATVTYKVPDDSEIEDISSDEDVYKTSPEMEYAARVLKEHDIRPAKEWHTSIDLTSDNEGAIVTADAQQPRVRTGEAMVPSPPLPSSQDFYIDLTQSFNKPTPETQNEVENGLTDSTQTGKVIHSGEFAEDEEDDFEEAEDECLPDVSVDSYDSEESEHSEEEEEQEEEKVVEEEEDFPPSDETTLAVTGFSDDDDQADLENPFSNILPPLEGFDFDGMLPLEESTPSTHIRQDVSASQDTQADKSDFFQAREENKAMLASQMNQYQSRYPPVGLPNSHGSSHVASSQDNHLVASSLQFLNSPTKDELPTPVPAEGTLLDDTSAYSFEISKKAAQARNDSGTTEKDEITHKSLFRELSHEQSCNTASAIEERPVSKMDDVQCSTPEEEQPAVASGNIDLETKLSGKKRKIDAISRTTLEEEHLVLAPLGNKRPDPESSISTAVLANTHAVSRNLQSPHVSYHEQVRPIKRLRRAAEVFGYVALGGVAVMSALIATAPAL